MNLKEVEKPRMTDRQPHNIMDGENTGSMNRFWKKSRMFYLHCLSNPSTEMVLSMTMQSLECKGKVWNIGKPFGVII